MEVKVACETMFSAFPICDADQSPHGVLACSAVSHVAASLVRPCGSDGSGVRRITIPTVGVAGFVGAIRVDVDLDAALDFGAPKLSMMDG